MTIKHFLSQFLYGVLFLTMSVPVHSMGDALPPAAPIGGEGPSVSLPEALPVATNPGMDLGILPQELPQHLANVDPATLSNIQSMALPSNYKIEEGDISILASDPHTLEVNLRSDTGIINWSHLNSSPNDHIIFHLLNSKSALLNRVDPTNGSSHFAGIFTSNGNVVLSNPAGVTFEKGSNTTVRGLLATTAHITNEDFIAGSQTGRYNFTKGAQDGATVNHGHINLVSGGFAALLGNTVLDDGVMLGQLSRVIVAGAQSYVLSFDGDSLIGFEITSTREKKESQPHKGPNVEHSGSIINKGGLVLVTTKDAQKFVFEDSVNIKSIPQATTVEEKDGVITLKGTISVDGPQGGSIWAESSKDMVLDPATLTANGTEQKGGSVIVLGPELRSFGSTLRADGKLGGGKILFGGDYQGKNPNINNSKNSFLDNETVLSVNALENGNGGQFVIWADNLTQNWSTTESKGGANGGNGGLLNEISGKEDLDHHGKISTLAPKGEHGTVLFDPKNIIIDSVSMGLYTNNNYDDNPGTTTTINPENLVGIGNIILQATNDITVNPLSGFTLDLGATLTMSAGRSIILNDAIATQNADMTLTANAGSAILHGHRADTTSLGSIINPDGKALSAGTGLITLRVDPTVMGSNAAGSIDVGPISSSKGVTVRTTGTATQLINLYGNITSTAGDINLTAGTGANIVVQSTLTLTTTDASDIILNNTLEEGGHNVTITSGKAVTLTGGSSGLGNFDITGPNGINIGNNISAGGNIHLTGPVILTGDDLTFNSTTGNIIFSNNITGNNHSLTLSTHGVGALQLTGTVTGVNSFTLSGGGQNNLSGSISSISQSYINLTLLGALTLITTGDLHLESAVQGAKPLILDIGGSLTYNAVIMDATLFNNQSSLTIRNNAAGLGSATHPIQVDLGDGGGTSKVLLLGSTKGGFFGGPLNGARTSLYSELLGTASGDFYVNGTLLPYPTPPQTSPVNTQQSGTITDNAINATDAPEISSEIQTEDERQKSIKALVSISTATEEAAETMGSGASDSSGATEKSSDK